MEGSAESSSRDYGTRNFLEFQKGGVPCGKRRQALFLTAFTSRPSQLRKMSQGKTSQKACLSKKTQMKRRPGNEGPASVLKNWVTTRPTGYNQLQSIDLTNPGGSDGWDNCYLAIALDGFRKCASAHPIPNKEATSAAGAIIGDARDGQSFAKQSRTDNGSEWLAQFDNQLRRRLTQCAKGLPHRSTTDSRHQRLHASLNPATGATPLDSGLQFSFAA